MIIFIPRIFTFYFSLYSLFLSSYPTLLIFCKSAHDSLSVKADCYLFFGELLEVRQKYAFSARVVPHDNLSIRVYCYLFLGLLQVRQVYAFSFF